MLNAYFISPEFNMTSTNETTPAANGSVRVENGKNGLPKVVLEAAAGNRAELYLQGAHITSWRSRGVERLFLSEKAIYSPGTAIRGGIPLVFPQFGPGPLPSHGFARITEWSLKKSGADHSNAHVALELKSDSRTFTLWPYEFEATLTIVLNESLSSTIEIRNLGRENLNFQWAFHTYFKTDVSATNVIGLTNLEYLDNLKAGAHGTESRAEIVVTDEVDRVYIKAPNDIVVASKKQNIVIQKQGLPDAVLWNPWFTKSSTFKDMTPDEYLSMICVETGAIASPVLVRPHDTFTASQSLSATDL